MVSIFIWKIERKELHFLTVKELEVLSLGLRSLFIVEKRALGLLEPECMRCEWEVDGAVMTASFYC